jgi:hypothetical protein
MSQNIKYRGPIPFNRGRLLASPMEGLTLEGKGAVDLNTLKRGFNDNSTDKLAAFKYGLAMDSVNGPIKSRIFYEGDLANSGKRYGASVKAGSDLGSLEAAYNRLKAGGGFSSTDKTIQGRTNIGDLGLAATFAEKENPYRKDVIRKLAAKYDVTPNLQLGGSRQDINGSTEDVLEAKYKFANNSGLAASYRTNAGGDTYGINYNMRF